MRINHIHIYSPNLTAQLEFYEDVMELPVVHLSETKIKITIGFSELLIEENRDATPYHIAFHIPPKQEEKALSWLKKRVEIQGFKGDEIIDFSSWNAKSIYFYDQDKNILEFIGREDYFQKSELEFSSKSILGIAEVGLATNNVAEKHENLTKDFPLRKYSGNLEEFCPIGDDEGLLIVIDVDKKDWFPTNDKAYASPFEISFTEEKKQYKFSFSNNKITKLSL
ncbi:VOC family protein [Haloflavibacter putidus]|uniref:VOC family protein n=1 Tax=Haloflavibacter putidus TaxID=2576776 RepID=A0A507ZUB5_9FLAO|nr:VOC family protein [Haloflavibacter putidus]TQD39338.1 VOC family protein [Haloflavibacter putidus]